MGWSLDALYTKLRPMASNILKNTNRQLRDSTEYLNIITSMKNMLAQANIMPVFFILFQVKRSQNS